MQAMVSKWKLDWIELKSLIDFLQLIQLSYTKYLLLCMHWGLKKNRDAIGRDHHVVWMKWHGHLQTGENESKKQIPENSKHWVVVDKFLQDGIQRQKRKMVPRSHVDQFQNELNNVHKLYQKNVQQQTTM